MISIPDNDPPSSASAFGGALVRGIPRSYAVLFFSPNPRLGWFLLAVSMLAPDLGIAGLLGVCATAALAWILGMDRAGIRSGYLLFNPLLVCLTLAWLHRSCQFSTEIYIVLFVAAVIGSLFLSATLQHWCSVNLGMSAHSLPAVMAVYVLYFFCFWATGPYIPTASSWSDQSDLMQLGFLPPFWKAMFQAFGAMLFQTNALVGLLVFLGLASTSPLAALIAAASFSVGAGVMHLLGFPLGPEGVTWCGFNFLLCGIALGSGYFAVSRVSLVLALSGAFLCALVAIALNTALRYFGLPASALPYNLVVLVMVYALKQRRIVAGLYPSPAPGALPESAARQVLIQSRRFPFVSTPALSLPFDGPRVITQGVDGTLTHRGAWRFALDFEAEKEGARFSGDGTNLEDYAIYDTNVLAPCGGVISAAVSVVPDNTPGSNNPDRNWGNYVLIYSDAGYHVMLAHLKMSSLTVWIGQRVERGMVIGRCGNSGRSPVPHLHLQIQGTPHLGAATRPFCLKSYIEMSSHGKTRTYHTADVPAAGTQIAPATPLMALAAGLGGWLPGEYRYRITGDNEQSWEETLLLDFDERGWFRFRSRRFGARLSAFLSENVFYATEFDGPGQSLLALFAVGLARVPCIADAGVEWHDQASIVPFFHSTSRWFQQLLDPFLGPSVAGYSYRFECSEKATSVKCKLESCHALFTSAPSHAPMEITTTLRDRRGVEELQARLTNDHKLHAELVEWQPLR